MLKKYVVKVVLNQNLNKKELNKIIVNNWKTKKYINDN